MPIQNKRVRRIALAILILVPVVALGWYLIGNRSNQNLPVNTLYQGKTFMFTYPREGALKEYASGVVSVGNQKGNTYSPLVEIVRYQSDPDVATPASFEAFAKQQAQNLCGSDSAESVTCSNVTTEPYVTPLGYKGLKLSLTMTRTNLASGTSTAATYAPIYAVNTTQQPDAGEKLRYSGVFVYYSLPSVLSGSVSSTLLDEVMTTLKIPGLTAQPTAPQASGA